MEWRLCLWASGSVQAITIYTLQRGSPAPDAQYFSPFRT